MELESRYFLVLAFLAIIFISGCIRVGEACDKEGRKTTDDSGVIYECKNGKWAYPIPTGSNQIDTPAQTNAQDYINDIYGNPSQAFNNTAAKKPTGACVYCDESQNTPVCAITTKDLCTSQSNSKGIFKEGSDCGADTSAEYNSVCKKSVVCNNGVKEEGEACDPPDSFCSIQPTIEGRGICSLDCKSCEDPCNNVQPPESGYSRGDTSTPYGLVDSCQPYPYYSVKGVAVRGKFCCFSKSFPFCPKGQVHTSPTDQTCISYCAQTPKPADCV